MTEVMLPLCSLVFSGYTSSNLSTTLVSVYYQVVNSGELPNNSSYTGQRLNLHCILQKELLTVAFYYETSLNEFIYKSWSEFSIMFELFFLCVCLQVCLM